MKKLIIILAATLAAATQDASAQHGLVGFANYDDLGLQGTTGGAGGKIVHVDNRSDFERYAGAKDPYIIILDADLKGHYDYSATPKQKHDAVTVSSNKTIIGGGSGAHLDSLGLDVKDSHNIIIRNLRITKADPDALAFRNSHHIWVDHCDLSSQKEENDANDGLLDFTYGSSYLTVSWCRFHDHDKSSICSSGTRNINDHGRQRVTYHHNAFINCTQRNPRIGYGLGHIFNDYNENNSLYAIGIFGRARVNVDNCYFKNVKEVFSQMYATSRDDAYWGFVKAENCVFEGKRGESNSGGFDVGRYYEYDFAMDKAADMPSMLDKTGCAEGIESDIIPFPGDGATGIRLGARPSCGDIEGAESYSYEIGTSAEQMQSCTPDEYALQPGTRYFWRVTVNGGPHDGKKSGIFRFSTASAQASAPTPEDGERHAMLREVAGATQPCEPLTLRWRKGFDATGYTLFLGEREDLEDAAPVKLTANEYRPKGLEYGKTYYWRVDTDRKDGSSAEGEVWSFGSDVSYAQCGRNEAEHAVRAGLCFPELDNMASWILASNDSCTVGDEGPGCMSFVWAGEDGEYDIKTTYFDEKSGNGWYGVSVNEELKDSWTATANNNKLVGRTVRNVPLNKGDELRIDFYTDSKMRCRTDCIDISKSAGQTGISSAGTPHTALTHIYSLDGRHLGNDVTVLKKGIYIINKRKVVVR